MLEVTHEELMALPTIIFNLHREVRATTWISQESLEKALIGHPILFLVLLSAISLLFISSRAEAPCRVFFRVKRQERKRSEQTFSWKRRAFLMTSRIELAFESKCEYPLWDCQIPDFERHSCARSRRGNQSATGEGLSMPIDGSLVDTRTVQCHAGIEN
jgi:hypothetical protein